MLNLNPDTVCELINAARTFHSQDAVALPDEPTTPESDWAARLLEPHSDEPSFQAFKLLVDDLEPDQQQQVVALLWLGRGDYSLEEWEDAIEQACADWTPDTAAYLLAHPLLADHLREGLELHGYSCD